MSMSTGGKAQINMTPMIDILLVLIIIFMVIAPVTSRGLNTKLPQPATVDSPSAPTEDIVLTVCLDGTVKLNQQPVEVSRLHDRLAELFRLNLNHVVFVRGEKGIDFRPVAEVIDIARGVGLDRIALMTK